VARKSSKELIAELAAEDDGLLAKPVGVWSLEKLAILHLYFGAFTTASKSLGGGYYFDGFAGPGMCKVRNPVGLPYLSWGSPILALNSAPGFERCIFLELSDRNADALQERVKRTIRTAKAEVHVGDVNVIARTILEQVVPKWASCFCLLDQQGGELLWSTVMDLASIPGRKRKPELLILFPLRMSLLRLLSVSKPVPASFARRWDLVFGHHGWAAVHQARLDGLLTPEQARAEYLSMYELGLKDLGYSFVRARPISAPRAVGQQRQEMYHLVFATDHERGDAIMEDVFKRPYALDFVASGQSTLFEI